MFSRRLRSALWGAMGWGTLGISGAGAAAMAAGTLALRWLLDEALPIGERRLVVVALAAFGAASLASRVLAALTRKTLAERSVHASGRALEGAIAVRFRRGFQELQSEGPGSASLEVGAGSRLAQGLQALAGQVMGLASLTLAAGGALLVMMGPWGLVPAGAALVLGLVMLPLVLRSVLRRRALVARRDAARGHFLGLAADTMSNLLTIRSMPDRGLFVDGLAQAAMAQRVLDHEGSLMDARLRLQFGLIRAVSFGAGLASLWLIPGLGSGTLVAAALSLGSLLAAGEALGGLLMQAADLEEALLVLPPEAASGNDGRTRSAGPIRRLEVRGVWFRYAEGPWVLKDVNLVLEAGKVEVLSWPSGAGKSTLLRVLAGALKPERGEVLVNGEPLSAFDLEDLRLRLGILPQGADLLSGTVYQSLEPVLNGAGEAGAWALLEHVEAAGFVRELPLGLHTRLLQGGASLSGGQQRRIALARALAPDRDLLLLDEPLSGTGESTAWLMEKLSGRGGLVCSHENG